MCPVEERKELRRGDNFFLKKEMTKSVLNYFALAAASSSDTRTQTLKPHDVEKEKNFLFSFTACRLRHVVIQSRQTYTHGPDNRGIKCCQK